MPLFQPNVRKLKEQRNVKELIKALNYQKDDNIRNEAAVALGEIGDPLAIEPLRAMLDTYLYESAAVSLSKLGDMQGIEAMFAKAMDDSDWRNDRSKPIYVLECCGAAAVPYLSKLLKVEPYALRAQAAKSLGNLADPRAAEALIYCLDDKYEVAQDVHNALLKIGAPAIASFAKVLAGMEKCSDTWLQHECLITLAEFGAKAVEPLIDFLAYSESHKDLACTLLGKIGDARAIEPLLQALNDPNKKVQKAARQALVANGWVKARGGKPAPARLTAPIDEIEFVSLSARSQGAGPGESEFENALSCWNAGDTASAQRAYKKALKTGLTTLYEAAARMNLGKIYFQQRDIAAAVNEFQKVIHLNPQRASTAYDSSTYLALIYQALGYERGYAGSHRACQQGDAACGLPDFRKGSQ